MPNHFQTELIERYLQRSALFWKFSRDAKFARWQREARNAAWQALKWDCELLNISTQAKAACERLGFTPGEIFAHPEVLQQKPELFEYYRLIGCLPNKGLGQIKQQLGLSKKSDQIIRRVTTETLSSIESL